MARGTDVPVACAVTVFGVSDSPGFSVVGWVWECRWHVGDLVVFCQTSLFRDFS